MGRENITIINFHNALLPNYPGRNAPSWVIYRGEAQTGITWHYVTAGVDEGNIIIQKTCEIGPDTKAYELAEKLMDLACEGYFACFDAVLEEGVEAKAQELLPERKLYRSTQMPGDGFLDLGEEPEKIYRLLRSVCRPRWRERGRKFCDTAKFCQRREKRKPICCICRLRTGIF